MFNEDIMDGPSVSATVAQSAMNPEKVMEMVLTCVLGLCSVFSLPVEMFIRPWFGTTYFSPITVGLSAIVVQSVGVLAYVLNFWPATTTSFMGTLVAGGVFWALFAFHTLRITHLMRNLPLEIDSAYEGPPVWYVRMLPKGDAYFWSRSCYEPIIVMVAGTALLVSQLTGPIVALFVMFSAIALVGKTAVLQYQAWLYVRTLWDRKGRGPIIEAIANGGPAPQTVGGKVVPMSGPPQARAAVITGMHRMNRSADSVTDQAA